jgi:hypothetical protein
LIDYGKEALFNVMRVLDEAGTASMMMFDVRSVLQ